MNLSELKTGEIGVIVRVNGSGAFRKRILEMGFIRGKAVKVILNAPLRDPIKYKIMEYEVSLRRSEASLIEVVYPKDHHNEKVFVKEPFSFDNSYDNDNSSVRPVLNGTKHIRVALVGNPNAGKTSLFNIASGAHEHVGNYGGVTVDSKEGKFKQNGCTFTVVDLPGTYSISAYTPEELFVRKHLVEDKPDIVINVIAASNLERNLYLTTELIDLELPIVIALNMYDELEDSGSEFDYLRLSQLIGIPIVPTIAKTGAGIPDLFDMAMKVYEQKEPVVRRIKIYYGYELENAISRINILMDKEKKEDKVFPTRYLSIKLLEKDKAVKKYIQDNYQTADKIFDAVLAEIKQVETSLQEDTESIITNARYGFVAGGLKETFKEKTRESDATRLIDAVVTNKYWGFPLFFFFMWVMFECTFRLGSYPTQWIEAGVEWLGNLIRGTMPNGMLKDLLVDGIIGGVGGVIVFLPNIVILYAFISFMEDSGYMARAAFIMDKVMHKMGLHGKSFIPLVMGFGCNVPAILATRTIESRNSRMITMLVNPFMSCSARLPVYLLFAGIFFGSYAGLVLFGLYVVGILLAVISARLFRRFLFAGEDTPFVMELPPYRIPTIKAVFRHMWDKTQQYLKKMGGIILIASIIIWFLQYFPQQSEIETKIEFNEEQLESRFSSNLISEVEKNNQIALLGETQNTAHIENSYIGKIGKSIEPLIKPLGFDWRVGVSLLSGMAAKEVVVSTLGVLYTGNDSDDQVSLRGRLLDAKNEEGEPAFTPLIVMSLLLFVLIYFPCIATVAAIKEESGSWKWGMFSIVYTTALAWIISFLVYQIGSLL